MVVPDTHFLTNQLRQTDSQPVAKKINPSFEFLAERSIVNLRLIVNMGITYENVFFKPRYCAHIHLQEECRLAAGELMKRMSCARIVVRST